MGAEDGVRWLTLLSGTVLFYSTLLQLQWQRTQANRDEESAPAPPAVHPAPAPPAIVAAPTSAAATQDEEEQNVERFKEVRRENAIKPYFDKDAFRLFILGFFISIISAALDLLAHGPLREVLNVTR